MENKIKFYEVVKDESDIYAISLVEDPAIESNFIYLSKEKPKQVFLESEEKHLIFGAVLIPDFPIYRFDGINEYYIQFPKETIEKLSHDYMLNGRLKSFTEQHEKDIYGEVTIVESWIKLSDNDKSVDLGLDVPIGTWIIGAKVHDVDVWDKIKNGEVKGFSVESFVSLDEIEKLCKSKKDKNMFNEESFLEKLQLMIETALGKVNKTEELSVEEPKIEEPQSVVEEVVEEKVEETEEKVETEEVVEETATEEPKKEEEVDEVKVEMEKTIQSLKEELDSIKAELASVKEENVKLSKQPSVEPISTSTEKESKSDRFSNMLNIMNGNAFRK